MGAATVLGLNLGPGPMPQSAAQWEQRIHSGVLSLMADDDGAHLWDQVQIVVTPAGTDLQQMQVDLTGLQITEEHRSVDLHDVDLTAVPAVTAAQQFAVHHLQVLARPLRWEGIPVTAQVDIEAVPAFAARDGAQNLWALLDPDQAATELRGEAVVSVPLERALRRARQIVARELTASGLTLTDMDVQVQTPAPRHLVVQAKARIRQGVLSAAAQVRIEVQVDTQMMARVGQIQARSRNPLVALFLAALRRRLQRYTDTTIDLNAQMPPGLRLADLTLRADADLTARATVT